MKINVKTGIYKILNKASGNFYIGSSSYDLINRWSTHKYYLKKNKHHSPALQNAYNKYGLEVLEFIILEECPPDKCIEREQYYIDTLDPEYNCCKIAGSTRGVKASQKQRETSSRVHKGNQYAKGNKLTPEQIKKREESRRLNGNNQPMLGKKHSEETKRKFSEQRKGKAHPWVSERLKVKIYCFNNDTTYDSIQDAIKHILETTGIKLHNPNISNVINGKYLHTKGFRFKKI